VNEQTLSVFPGILPHSVPEPNSGATGITLVSKIRSCVCHVAVTDGSEVEIAALRYSALASCFHQGLQKLMD
jgi:hypothetical protein